MTCCIFRLNPAESARRKNIQAGRLQPNLGASNRFVLLQLHLLIELAVAAW
jgi:hypothetical protein